MNVRLRLSRSVLKAVMKCLLLCNALSAPIYFAESLDDAVALDDFLGPLIEPLDGASIDVTLYLNERDLGRGRPDSPRLGGFWDIPSGLLPTTDELNHWERELAQQSLGGLAVFPCQHCSEEMDEHALLKHWFSLTNPQRLLITFSLEDELAAQRIAAAATARGFVVRPLVRPDSIEFAGELYATAGRRLALDSRSARRLNSEVTEMVYLGERSRRGSSSIFSGSDSSRGLGLARNEPAVFLKESLGDEFTQSTIEEIIVPGGVALGETARLTLVPVALEFDGANLILIDDQEIPWQLPAQSLTATRSLFDFVERSVLIGSDAIVDIDENARVSISSALRDTSVGFDIMHADTLPFEYIPNLPVTKSVIIDTYVKWTADAIAGLDFETEFEVRFLSADNMRIAQTRAALVYEYESARRQVTYKDAWGRETRRLNEKIDYAGLGNSVVQVAHYAGWIGLFRYLKEEEVPFLKGRYQFLKIDHRDRETPVRY